MHSLSLFYILITTLLNLTLFLHSLCFFPFSPPPQRWRLSLACSRGAPGAGARWKWLSKTV